MIAAPSTNLKWFPLAMGMPGGIAIALATEGLLTLPADVSLALGANMGTYPATVWS